MHNCEDGDENESVSLDAALSAASKNQGNLLKGIEYKTVKRKGFKGQLDSEWIYEVIVSPIMPTKNFKYFCPTL